MDSRESVSNKNQIKCSTDFRGYWQVYWSDKNGGNYRINKNNSQVNVYEMDHENELEITLLHEADFIRIDFKMTSGNAYFYAGRS